MQGWVEPFDLAVVPGAVGTDEHVPDAPSGQDLADRCAAGAGQVVVGHESFDGDRGGGERVQGPGEEPGGGRAGLVGQDLAVGVAGVVIDQGVDEVVADTSTAQLLCSAVHAPAAAVGSPADLLDVGVDQRAGIGMLVAQRGRLRCPDHDTGQRVELVQVGHGMAAQDPRDRAGRDPGLGCDPARPTTLSNPQGHHSSLEHAGGASRPPMRGRATIMQAGRALGPVPVDPTVSALAPDALSLRRVGNRPLLLKHALDQQQPAMKRQTGLRARHEDLQCSV